MPLARIKGLVDLAFMIIWTVFVCLFIIENIGMYHGWKDIPTIFEIDFGGGQVDSQSRVRGQTTGGDAI